MKSYSILIEDAAVHGGWYVDVLGCTTPCSITHLCTQRKILQGRDGCGVHLYNNPLTHRTVSENSYVCECQ